MPATRAHGYCGPRRRGAGAFSLLELMIVVVIIALLAAMVVPELGGSSETVQLDAAAGRVADMMDFCYHNAVATGKIHALVFDQTMRRFDVVSEGSLPEEMDESPPDSGDAPSGPLAASASAAAGTTAAPPPSDAPVALVPVPIPGFVDKTLPEGIAIAGVETYETDLSAGDQEGQYRILFFPDGTTEFAKVELAEPSGARRQVFLNGLDGDIQIINPEANPDAEATLASMIVNEDESDDMAEDQTANATPEQASDNAPPPPMQ